MKPMQSSRSVKLPDTVSSYWAVEDYIKENIDDHVLASIYPVTSPDFELIKFQIRGAMDSEAVNQAIAILRGTLAPCHEAIALKAMHNLRTRCVATKADTEIADRKIALYLADLIRYPEDVVVAACLELGDKSRWFPAWADLYEALERRVKRRKLMLEVLDGKAQKEAG